MSKASVSKRQRIGSLYVNVVKGQDSQMRNIRNAEEKLSKNKILIEMDNLNEVQVEIKRSDNHWKKVLSVL